jgi:hypothetical protein
MRRSLVVALLVALVLPTAAAGRQTVYFTTSSPLPGTSRIWSVPASGGKPKLVRRRMPDGPQGGAAALSRNGRRIYCVCRQDEVGSIRTDGTHLHRVGPLPRAVRYDIVTLGPDGRAYWVKAFTKVFSLAPGARRASVFRAVRTSESVVDERIVPSPNGHRIAFIIYGCLVPDCPDGDVETLFSAKVDGSDRTVVYQSTGEGKEIGEVAWSADSRKLVFADGTGEGDPKGELPNFYPTQYLVAPADGSNPAGTPVTLPEEGFNPFFSPDAGRFVFTTWAKPNFALGTAPVAGGAASPMTRTSCRYPACIFPPRVFGWR